MYTSDKNHRNIIDLSKTTYIRLMSPKQEIGETPPHSFDIVTTDREWTLCAESRENAIKWLKLLNQAIHDDNAILPDEELSFNVKAKVVTIRFRSTYDNIHFLISETKYYFPRIQ